MRVFKFCLRRMLGQRQRATLFVFLDCLSRVLSESHQIGELDGEPNSVLSDQQLLLLDEAYQIIIPKYKNLSSEYKTALQKAKNARRKSLFPPHIEWELKKYLTGSSERDMLVGPTSSFFLMKRIINKDLICTKIILHEHYFHKNLLDEKREYGILLYEKPMNKNIHSFFRSVINS